MALERDNDTASRGESNPRGIPYAPFVDRVEEYVNSQEEVEGTLKNFQELISKYQFMEMNTAQRASSLRLKIPDIQKTLLTVQFLQTRSAGSKPLQTTFELNDTLYARANIQPTDEVYLWLGANVMLSYPLLEAIELLEQKLGAALQSLENCDEDIDFLREQVTTLEVATARVYNWDVAQRRKDKNANETDGNTGSKPAADD